jgi:hypothetical protein
VRDSAVSAVADNVDLGVDVVGKVRWKSSKFSGQHKTGPIVKGSIVETDELRGDVTKRDGDARCYSLCRRFGPRYAAKEEPVVCVKEDF